jgi:predicted trehalose synthase
VTTTALTYLLGIVDAGRELPASAWPLHSTDVGRIAAVHAAVAPSALEVTPDIAEDSPLAHLALWHDGVVRRLAEPGPVLPVRLGCVLPSPDALRDLLAARADDLAADLDRVRGRAEWTVRLSRAPHSVVDEAGTGGEYLRARQSDVAAERRLTAAIGSMHEALAALSDEVVMGPPRAFLVRRTAPFVATAEQWADRLIEAGCTVELAGPLPPYSFVHLELGLP